MGLAKTPAWQPTAFQTKLDESTGRWVARTRYRDGGEKLVLIKRQGRTMGAAELAVWSAIEGTEELGKGHKSTTLTVGMLAAESLDLRKPAAVEIDPETQSGGPEPHRRHRPRPWPTRLGAAMVEFARQIQAQLVAEGIESEAELAAVTGLGM